MCIVNFLLRETYFEASLVRSSSILGVIRELSLYSWREGFGGGLNFSACDLGDETFLLAISI